MKLRIFSLLLLALAFCSCGSKQGKNDATEDENICESSDYSNSKDLIDLYHQADSLVQIGQIDIKKMQLFVDNATAYAKTHPDDTLTPHFLLYAGIFEMDIALSTPSESKRNARFFQAVDIFNNLTKKYPDYKNLPYCYYYKGQIYENMKRTSDAEGEYRELVHRYPDTDLGRNIADYLKVQGYEKSSDDIMHEISQK
ncbi:MAG: tetratricopeptide repeat protein [Bacteroidales bacterium]|nr:tetratricopeptide repeat protein [Bacteroidales bacterium]